MIYRQYGKTEDFVSAIGFGGMRFDEQMSPEDAASMVKFAYDSGINYFDTAPMYCRDMSEKYYGMAFKEMKKTRDSKPFYVSTKTRDFLADKIRKSVERSLKRFDLEYIDFLHVWCVMNPEDYRWRVCMGALKTLEKLKEEHLIRHICVSTHMNGEDIGKMLESYPFDGVLLGYSAMNFAYREKALDVAKRLNDGVAIMNPLGGGLIPRNPDKFAFVKTQENESVVEGALRFLLDDNRITLMLVGFSSIEHIKEALSAVNGYHPLTEQDHKKIRQNLKETFNSLCTCCRYCDHCPQKIAIPKFMDAYNQYLLTTQKKYMIERLTWHWGNFKDALKLNTCLHCGLCEKSCTQHLPIMERLQELYNAVQDDMQQHSKK